MKYFDVVLKLRISAISEKQMTSIVAALIKKIEAEEYDSLSVIEAVVEVPLQINRGR